MSNIDKRALREAAANAKIAGEAPVMPFDQRITALNDFLKHCTPETVLVLLDEIAELEQRHCGTALLEREEMHTKTLGRMLDELDAKDRRNSELTEALKQTVSGYKSCLRMGHDRILDLGGDCDSPEVMIAGNPDIQQAEKLIAAAAGKGE